MVRLDLSQGTLDLRGLSAGEMHGWSIAQRLNVLSKDARGASAGSSR